MSDLETLKRALSAWQLCQVATYMRDRGDNWSAGVLERVAERYIEEQGKEIGRERIAEAMRRVLDYMLSGPNQEAESALEDAFERLDADTPDDVTVH